MDGGNENPAINLHKEFITSDNIVDLFKKHEVPHPDFDHLTGAWGMLEATARHAMPSSGLQPTRLCRWEQLQACTVMMRHVRVRVCV